MGLPLALCLGVRVFPRDRFLDLEVQMLRPKDHGRLIKILELHISVLQAL